MLQFKFLGGAFFSLDMALQLCFPALKSSIVKIKSEH